jgi:hypothetical protein
MGRRIRKSSPSSYSEVRPSGDGHGKSRGFSQGWSNVKRRSSRRGSSASRRSGAQRTLAARSGQFTLLILLSLFRLLLTFSAAGVRMERIVRPSGDGHGKSRGFSQGWSNVKRRSSRRDTGSSKRSVYLADSFVPFPPPLDVFCCRRTFLKRWNPFRFELPVSFEPQRHQVGTRCDDDVDMRHRERAVGAVELELANMLADVRRHRFLVACSSGAPAPPTSGISSDRSSVAATTVTPNVSEHVQVDTNASERLTFAKVSSA